MPYIDSTPKESLLKFEEDNLQDVFGKMLTENGWVKARSFYKAVVDARAYVSGASKANYAIAKHDIFKNADGKLLGFATVAQFYLSYLTDKIDPIRRINDEQDPKDLNFGRTPSWEEWVKQKFAEASSKTNLYFYMLEKLPNSNYASNDSIVSIITAPGMGGTAYNFSRDIDRINWYEWWYGYSSEDSVNDPEGSDMEFDGHYTSASPYHVIRSALDIEVLGTEFSRGPESSSLELAITKADPRVMQSPMVKTTLRAQFLEHINNPIWHTNWWTDSEIRVRGYVDSRTIFLILQADNAPAWESNLVPTIPLYFGRINSTDGDGDEGYALFGGTVPPASKVTSANETTSLARDITSEATQILVNDGEKLPEAPTYLIIGNKGTGEIVKLLQKSGNLLLVERAQQGTTARAIDTKNTLVQRLTTNSQNADNETIVSTFDFDDPGSKVGETIQPLLKLYPHHPSNGVDSVMVSRSRFGARYQAHYLSWSAPPNQLPPTKMTDRNRKYPRAYESMENTKNYKYQFNASRYSNKIHSSRIAVIHPEEGIRGYLDKAIGFNAQSVNAANLRVRKTNCPEKVYEMYRYLSIGAVSPLTKVPATPFRPVGLGIYAEDFNPNAVPHDIENDVTPPDEVIITNTSSPQAQTIDLAYTLPTDADLSYINIYVDGSLYAKGITGTNQYRITGLTTGFSPEIKITTVDLAGNESVGVVAPTVAVA
ncbi:hypothetical protein [Aeromonas caviae]|uniref:hypothetical protein n=1 Tax=Aeromonas caviae TaxID=648 RepID=UPI003989D4C8